jgi:hypothetical protein
MLLTDASREGGDFAEQRDGVGEVWTRMGCKSGWLHNILSVDRYRSAGTMMVEKLSVTNCELEASRARVRWGASQDAEATLGQRQFAR